MFATALIVSPAAERTASAVDMVRKPVVVSLTYDDGTADQMQAGTIMQKYGMRGTFYVNSSRLGAPGRMTKADALKLQADGHEIGGHTVTHADLPTLERDEQKRQICNDRKALMGHGLRVTNLAYPYGDDSPEVHQVTAECGYNSGRVVGDIVSPGTCKGCPFAERIPPANPYAVRTPDSVKPSTTLETMENYVLQAEQSTGGWVVIVMHRVCNDCDPYAVTPAKLDAFLSWLSERAAGGTVVKTVNQVIGGANKPAVSGPPPAPRESTLEMLRNPGMETDSNGDGIPNCWQRGGYGDNSYTWSKAANPHGGAVSQQVQITRFVNGDRRIMTSQDLGACAPGATAGHTYEVSGWYRTNGANRLTAYYRDESNRWIYLSQGPVLPVSATTWQRATWRTPALPAGATALAVGFSLRSVGVLAGDDFSVMDSDQTAPTVAMASPEDGSRLRGTVAFTANASDASGVEKVDFLVDGEVACTASTAPFRCQVDTLKLPDTVIAVTAKATDTAGNETLSAGRNYTVSNTVAPDLIPPVASLTAPTLGATVSDQVQLTASASDNDRVGRVLFYAGGELVGASSIAPYTMTWDSNTAPDGPIVLQAKALDLSGNLGASVPVAVTVGNYRLDTTAPQSTVACNGVACGTSWYPKPVVMSLTATDVGSGVSKIVYTTNGSEPTATNGAVYRAPVTVPASTTVRYRAIDRAGNLEPVRSLVLRIDTVAPTATVSAPVNGTSVTGVVYIKATVADANGIARVNFLLDGKALGSRTVAPYQWRWDTATATKGSHTLQAVAVDPAGNQTRSATVTVTVS